MRILYLRLKNFSMILTGLNALDIQIDFSKAKNKIILLEGPNGIGKTTIMSTIHPFATNGTFDIRNEVSLIIEGEEGYKEIHIQDGSDIYVIKHFYYPNKDTHTSKSYIEKNGIELNENGNVTSFKDIVKDELDLEIDYLKLIRLGSNVKGFIDLKSTDRKAFMSKILSEVDIFLRLHKKISKDITAVKSVLSHNIDKIKKLGIDDLDMVQKEIEVTRSSIVDLNKNLMTMNEKWAICNHELSKLPDGKTLNSMLKDTQKDYQTKLRLIEKTNIGDVDVNSIIKELESKINNTAQKLSILNEKILLYKNQLNDYISNKKTLMVELDKESTKEDVSSLESMIKNLTSFVEKSDVVFRDFKPEYNKNELETAISVIYTNQRALDITYEFGEKPVKKVIKLMRKEHSVQEFVSNKLNVISSNKMKANSNYVFERLLKKFPILYPNCGDSSCGVFKFWKEFKSIIDQKNIDDVDIETEEFYNYMNLAYTNIKRVFYSFGDNKELFMKMPLDIQEMLKLDKIYEHISKTEIIYDRDILYDQLTRITEYDIYLDKKNELKKYKDELEIKKNSSNKKMLLMQLNTINTQIEDIYAKLKELSDEEVTLDSTLDKLNSDYKDYSSAKIYMDEKDNIELSITEYTNQLKSVNELETNIGYLEHDHSMTELDLDKQIRKVSNLEFKCNEYNTLSEELRNLRDEYEEMNNIKDALSSKEGIPLLYINIYLRRTKEIANELLDIVYNGDMYIKSLKAKEDKFPIPYYKNNQLIKDIAMASQGERSIASLSLSFALSCQNLSKYNIMLLDELDSTLDTNNRKLFIKILEKQMEFVDSEQVFLISHNDMFDMYPVTVLNFLGEKNKRLKDRLNKNKMLDSLEIEKLA